MSKIIVALIIIASLITIVAAADTFASLSETHDAVSWSVEKDNQINATYIIQKYDAKYEYYLTVYTVWHSSIIIEEKLTKPTGSYLFDYSKLAGGTYYINLQQREPNEGNSTNLDIVEVSIGSKSAKSTEYATWLKTIYSCNGSSWLTSGAGYI